MEKIRKRLYLFGSPISQSPSPLLHNSGFKALGIDNEYVYELFDTTVVEEVANCLRNVNTIGGNITIPHKQTIIPFLDFVDNAAKNIGAVNTVIKDSNGKLHGYNTDWIAIHKLITEKLYQKKDRKDIRALIVGAGGTAHAACYAVSQLNVPFYIFNRTKEKALQLLTDHQYNNGSVITTLMDLQSIDIVVSTVPPSAQFELPKHLLNNEPILVELVYNPRKTLLIKQGESIRCPIIEGIEILYEQGAAAFTIWTNKEPPIKAMKHVLLHNFRNGELLSDPPHTFRSML